MAVPLVWRKRTFDPAAFRPRAEGTGGIRPTGPPRGHAARAAPRVCQPSLAQRRRLAHRTDAAWPHGYLDDPDLHPCRGRAAEEPGARPASIGREVRAGLPP